MRRRDLLDASRESAPMTRAADAITLQTEGVNPEEVIDRIVSLARSRGALGVSERA
jgi:cytidylate kinase